MQSSDIPISKQEQARDLWAATVATCIEAARTLQSLGVAKEQANRVLPQATMVWGLVTMTEPGWRGFLALRNHPDADRATRLLAIDIQGILDITDWRISDCHLPFGGTPTQSVARCARVGNPPGKRTDQELYEHLVGSEPVHGSPAEHVAYWCHSPQASALVTRRSDLWHQWGWETHRVRLETAQ